MKRSLLTVLISLMGCIIFAGCGSNVAGELTEETVEAVSDEISEEAGDTEEEENPFDGGPDWVTLADQFTLPTSRMSIEDAVEKYAITLQHQRRTLAGGPNSFQESFGSKCDRET